MAAEAACRAFLASQPGHGKALLLMSAIQYRIGHADTALGFLREAARVPGADAGALIDVVLAMQRIGALESARALLMGMDQANPQVAELLAQNEWRMGNYDAALSRFRQAILQWPNLAAGYVSCARALIRLGMRSEAQTLLDRALVRFTRHEGLQRLKITNLLDQQSVALALLQARKMSAESAEDALFQSALRSVFTADAFAPPPGELNARVQAQALSHEWLLQQRKQLTWFGSDTGLLEWAARHAPGKGVFLEFGVYHGLSINLLASWTGREIHGFDSFEGLPEDWKEGEPAGSYSTGGKLPSTPANVSLHRGWFTDVLPSFFARLDQPVSLAHIDCDLYSSTRCVLHNLGPHLESGSLLVFDDFLAYPGYEQHEFRAAQECFRVSGLHFELEAAVVLGRSVAYRVK